MARSAEAGGQYALVQPTRRAFLARMLALGCSAPVVAASLIACRSGPPPTPTPPASTPPTSAPPASAPPPTAALIAAATTTLLAPFPPATRRPVPGTLATPATPATGTTVSAQAPRLRIDPTFALVDTPVRVQLDGLKPGQLVTLRARMNDFYLSPWSAVAEFRADGEGRIDVSVQAPEGGSYSGIDPMGLFWSMRPENNTPVATRFDLMDRIDFYVTLSAESDGVKLGTVTLVRNALAPGVVTTPVRDQGLFGTFYRPADPGPHPAVIVLGGSLGGLGGATLLEAALLASHGYAALALAYFNYGTLPKVVHRLPLEYFEQAIAWLQAQPSVRGDRIAACGYSLGGQLALMLGALFPTLSATVSFVGSGLVQDVTSSLYPWSYRGVAASENFPRGPRGEVIIPVERTNGPVLLTSCERDAVWPSTQLSEFAMQRLVQANRPYPDQHLVYPDAGHFLEPPYFPTLDLAVQGGGTTEANAAARADFWPRTLNFLDEHLKR